MANVVIFYMSQAIIWKSERQDHDLDVVWDLLLAEQAHWSLPRNHSPKWCFGWTQITKQAAMIHCVSSYIHVVWQSIKLPLLISYFCNLTQIWQWLFCGLKFVAGGGVQKGKRTVFLLIFNMILKNDTSKKWFFENLKVPCNCNYRTEKNGARGVGRFLILLF